MDLFSWNFQEKIAYFTLFNFFILFNLWNAKFMVWFLLKQIFSTKKMNVLRLTSINKDESVIVIHLVSNIASNK